MLLKAVGRGELDLDEFLGVLSRLVEYGFGLKEEVYVDAVREARRNFPLNPTVTEKRTGQAIAWLASPS